jgi:hypothetical protein
MIIEMLNMHIARLTVDEYGYKIDPTNSTHTTFERYGHKRYVYRWLHDDQLGKHIVNMINPDDLEINVFLDPLKREYNIDISTWLSTEQIDKIELAFFIKLRRRSFNTKYLYE